MSTAIIGTGGLGSLIARRPASGETLRLSSAETESARTLAAAMGRGAAAASDNRDGLQVPAGTLVARRVKENRPAPVTRGAESEMVKDARSLIGGT